MTAVPRPPTRKQYRVLWAVTALIFIGMIAVTVGLILVRGDCRQLEDDLVRQEKETADREVRNQALQEKNLRLEDQLRGEQKEKQELKDTLDDAAKSKVELATRLRDMTEARDRGLQKLAAVERARILAETKLADVEKVRAELVANVTSAQKALAEARNAGVAGAAKTKAMEDRNAELQFKLAKLESNLKAAGSGQKELLTKLQKEIELKVKETEKIAELREQLASRQGKRKSLHGRKLLQLPVDGVVGMDLVKVKKGTFRMGSPESEIGRKADEVSHEVTLTHDFWVGKFEVTRAQYAAVMKTEPDGPNLALPVTMIDWHEAMSFCAKLTEILQGEDLLPENYVARLMTEAEWEYACRAGTTTAYQVSGSLAEYAIYGRNEKGLVQVGSRRPNAWGIYGMHGNAKEWCFDIYGPYASGPVTGPIGVDDGGKRVIRGGSWQESIPNCRSACRGSLAPQEKRDDLGFRVVIAPTISGK